VFFAAAGAAFVAGFAAGFADCAPFFGVAAISWSSWGEARLFMLL
jgi:hypothetical protein